LSINDVIALLGEGQVFCDDNIKASILNSKATGARWGWGSNIIKNFVTSFFDDDHLFDIEIEKFFTMQKLKAFKQSIFNRVNNSNKIINHATFSRTGEGDHLPVSNSSCAFDIVSVVI